MVLGLIGTTEWIVVLFVLFILFWYWNRGDRNRPRPS